MKKRVLIYPCGTEIALEMWESLRYSKHFEPIGANDVPCAWPGNYLTIGEGDLLSRLNDMISTLGVDLFLPAHDDVIEWAALNADKFCCQVVVHPLETVQVCRSKKATYELFPEFSPTQITTFPMFVKPDKGNGSKGAILCENEMQLEAQRQRWGDLVQMEVLSGFEFTFDCFTDKDGKTMTEPRVRRATSNGISIESESTFAYHHTLISAICARLKMRGAWFFQMKGGKLLEIGPRIAGSSGFFRSFGINFTEMTLFDALGVDIEFQDNENGVPYQVPVYEFKTFRRLSTRLTGLEFDTVYVDYDDTIMVDGKPLPELVGLLYKWNNEGKKIVIVSRNLLAYPPFFLLDLQPDYIHCPRPEPKSRHVKFGGIFIDDSFTEREEVRENAGVPVFGLEALNMLW